MDTASYSFFVDWDNGPGQSPPVAPFLGTYDDISAYVLRANWDQFGRDPNGGSARIGQCRIKLDNSTGIFSPYNAASVIYGKILPNRRVRIVMTLFAVPVTMFEGDLQSIVPTVGETVSVGTAELIAYGVLNRTQNSQVHIPMQSDKTTGYLAGLVLDAMGYPAADRAIDTGLSTLGRYWISGKQPAIQALRELEAAEGGLIHETKDGKIQLESRGHRLTAPHNSAIRTYGTGTYNIWNLAQEDHLKSIWNVVEANCRTFNKSEDMVLVTVADVRNNLGGTPPTIPALGTLKVVMAYPDPNGSGQYPAVDTWGLVDYEANSAGDGTGTDITTDVSAVRVEYADRIEVTFTNANAGAAHLILLRAHGTAVVEESPIPVSAEDATSIADYGRQVYPNPSNWLTELGEAQDYCDHILALTKDPRPRISFTFKANYDFTHLEEAQRLNISDRLRIVASLADFGLAIDGDFFVEYLGHTVDEAKAHTVQIQGEAVATHTWAASGTSYTPKVVSKPGPPDDLWVVYNANGLQYLAGCKADKWNQGITEAEFRAKWFSDIQAAPVDLRTVAEGGTFAGGSSTEILVTGIACDQGGVAWPWDGTTAGAGVWYFAFRLKNAYGWSVWTDGNNTPRYVLDYVKSSDNSDTGPPSDWTVRVEAGTTPGTCVVVATRPKTNGNTIFFCFFQIKDATSSPTLRDIDGSTIDDDAHVTYDGSATAHTYDLTLGTMTRPSGAYTLVPPASDLLYICDVRNGAYGRDHCEWVGLSPSQVVGNVISNVRTPSPSGANTDRRIKIVRPPWSWVTDGYLGTAGFWMGEYWMNGGDKDSQEFRSKPFEIPTGVDINDILGRVWFGNAYSFGSGDLGSGPPSNSGSGSGSGYCVTLPYADPILTDARLIDSEKIARVSVATDCTLGNPTNAKCGQFIKWCIINTSGTAVNVTLDTKFRIGKAFYNTLFSPPDGFYITQNPIPIPANSQAYLTAIYDAVQDKFDVIQFEYDYLNASLPTAWAYWKMEEESSNKRIDSTGQGNDLTETNDPVARGTGKVNYAADFNPLAPPYGTDLNLGTDNYPLDDAPDFSGDKKFTYAFWVKVHRINDPSSYAEFYMDLGGNSDIFIGIGCENGDTDAYIWAEAGALAIEDYPYVMRMSFDAWHFVCLHYDQTGVYLEIDGVQVGSDLGSHGITYVGSMWIGGIYPDDLEVFLDEFGVWIGANALTSDQRSYLYNSGSGRTLY